MMNDSTAMKIAAIVCIAVIEGAAIITKVDGAYFGICVAAIAGLAGYTIAIAKETVAKK